MKTTVPVAIVLMLFASGPATADDPEGWYVDGQPDVHQGPFPSSFDCQRALEGWDRRLTLEHVEHHGLYCSYYDKYYYLVENAEIAGESFVSGPYTTLDKCREARAKQPGADKPLPPGSLYTA
jgi:hypothetical protein